VHLVLLLSDKHSNQLESLQRVGVNDFVRWCDIDHDVPHDVDENRFGFLAEFDTGEVKEPLQVPLRILFWQIEQHEV